MILLLGFTVSTFAQDKKVEILNIGDTMPGFELPGVDDKIEKARLIFDANQRNAIYSDIQDQLMEDVPAIPVYNFVDHEARQSYVDLGYEFKVVFNYFYRITEKTRILKH